MQSCLGRSPIVGVAVLGLMVVAVDSAVIAGTQEAVCGELSDKCRTTTEALKFIAFNAERTETLDDGRTSRSSVSFWRAGEDIRYDIRTFSRFTQDGIEEIPKRQRLKSTHYRPTETRFRVGWDDEDPSLFQLPLDPVERPDEFRFVSGSIGTAVSANDGNLFPVFIFDLLLQIAPNVTLDDLLATPGCECSRDESGIYRVILPKDVPAGDFLSGASVEIDSRHGWLVRRMDIPSAKVETVVEEFREFGDLWFPVRVKRRLGFASRTVLTNVSHVSKWDANAMSSVALSFPAGARISDSLTGQIHVWGKDGPAKSFPDVEGYQSFFAEKLREKAARDSAAKPDAQPASDGFLWRINVGALALLAVLAGLRAWLTRRKASPPTGV